MSLVLDGEIVFRTRMLKKDWEELSKWNKKVEVSLLHHSFPSHTLCHFHINNNIYQNSDPCPVDRQETA